ILSPRIVVEAPKVCLVCRGKITYFFYECPICKTLYHLKCAKALKDQGKGCFNCHSSFPVLPIVPQVKDAPIIVSIKKISKEMEGYLQPEEIQHKDLTTQFSRLKKALQEELIHKVSQNFYNDFNSQIEKLFKRISELKADELDKLDKIRSNQKKIFNQITEKLEDLIRFKKSKVKKSKIKCKGCGREILKEEDQKICEYCGEILK
ncbi:MAG: hypothetical protein ACTSQJ_13535, partial [Promethearchaeota archaeon]